MKFFWRKKKEKNITSSAPGVFYTHRCSWEKSLQKRKKDEGTFLILRIASFSDYFASNVLIDWLFHWQSPMSFQANAFSSKGVIASFFFFFVCSVSSQPCNIACVPPVKVKTELLHFRCSVNAVKQNGGIEQQETEPADKKKFWAVKKIVISGFLWGESSPRCIRERLIIREDL